MKKLLLVLIISFLTSCTATHNHYHYPDNDNYVESEIVNHSYTDYGDHIVVLVKHRHNLNKHQRQRLRKWCRHHYRHHSKHIKFKFILN